MFLNKEYERQYIPDACAKRFIHFGSPTERMWPQHEIEVAGLSRLVPGVRIERWDFPMHVALIVTAGQLDYEDANGARTISAGEFLFMPAYYKLSYGTKVPCETVWLHLIPGNKYWMEFADMHKVLVQKTRNVNKIPQLMEFLYIENMVPNGGNRLIQQLLCQLILQYLHEDLREMKGGMQLRPRLEECFQRVSANLASPWRLADLCRLAMMSRTVFVTACRKHYGRAPMTIVRQIRLNTAAQLLLTTADTLDAIAVQTGFDCGISLSKAFRKEYGCAPGHWRTHQKETPTD